MRVFLLVFVGSIVQATHIAPGAAQELPIGEIREIAGGAVANLPGLSVAIGNGDSLLWTGGFGLAALESVVALATNVGGELEALGRAADRIAAAIESTSGP